MSCFRQFSNGMIHFSFLLITFLFQMMKDEKYILVDSEESLANLLADLEQYDMAAVDTEADSMYHYTARLCLIQITIGEHHYIVDPLCGLDLAPLFKARAMQTLIFGRTAPRACRFGQRIFWRRTQKGKPESRLDDSTTFAGHVRIRHPRHILSTRTLCDIS